MKSKFFALFMALFSVSAWALSVGDTAPNFSLSTHEGKSFDLNSRKGQWTVLYFYPKADTPGCTKQACAFRDSIKVIRVLGADVFGISTDSVAKQKEFHDKHQLNFVLIADPDGQAAAAYDTKMPLLGIAKRHTFVIDPELKIRDINTDVDPVKDANHVAETLKKLQAKR